jgi:hypothetical protein
MGERVHGHPRAGELQQGRLDVRVWRQLAQAAQHVLDGLRRQPRAHDGAQRGAGDVTERRRGTAQGERHPVAQGAGEEQPVLLGGATDVDEAATQGVDAHHRLEDVDEDDARAARRRPLPLGSLRALRSRPGRHPVPSSSSSRAALRLLQPWTAPPCAQIVP